MTTSLDINPWLRRRAAVAVGFGNLMEWYDYSVYGFFAATIGRVFFPSQDATSTVLSSLAVFGVAFLMRPLGGLLFGTIGDKLGRRTSLAVSTGFMGISTTLMAVLPSYRTAGVVAPVLLVGLRCLQGVSAGGEWAGSASFLIEYAPGRRRARWGSVVPATAALGAFAGSLVALSLSSWLSVAQLSSWGWRAAFVLAAPLALVALYLRLRLADTPVYRELQRDQLVARAPFGEAVRHNFGPIALTFVFGGVTGLGYYYLATYTINFLTSTRIGMPRPAALAATAIGLAIYAALCPLAGLVADRHGRRVTVLVGCAGRAVAAIPAYLLMSSASTLAVVAGIAIFGAFEALANVAGVALLVELFPARTRMTGSNVGFNLSSAIIAGPGPLIAAALAARLDFIGAGALYVVAVAVLSLLALARFLPETRDEDRLAVPEVSIPAAATGALDC
jgi:MFS transporter, MHS family, proline/betaine transporter